jgi:cyclopropane fatty-acyl-phospholipid synthase-like methyltransferase
MDKNRLTELLREEPFPLSSKYDPEWVLSTQMGPNVLWMTEWLCEKMDLRPYMSVLDMGCGKTLSSIFLAKEFGVQVWANDLWISASKNWQRIQEVDFENLAYPIHAEERSLPYAQAFFDAIVYVDSYLYFATDDLYLEYFRQFVRLGVQIVIVAPRLSKDFTGQLPEHLTSPRKSGGVFWAEECWRLKPND